MTLRLFPLRTRLAARLPLSHYAALVTEAIQRMILSLETRGAALHHRLERLELARHLGVRLQLRTRLSVGAVILGELSGRPHLLGSLPRLDGAHQTYRLNLSPTNAVQAEAGAFQMKSS